MKTKNHSGHIHTLLIAVIIVVSVISISALRINQTNKENAKRGSGTAPTESSQLQQESAAKANDKQEVTTEPEAQTTPTSTPVQKSPQPTTGQPTTPQQTLTAPTKARIALINGNYIELPLNKGGDYTQGYIVQTCTKGGPGSEDNRPILSASTSIGIVRVQACKVNVYPTVATDRDNYSRLVLANNDYIDIALNKGGSGDGYIPAQCSNGGIPDAIIQVQTPVDVRNLQLCSNHAFAVTEL